MGPLVRDLPCLWAGDIPPPVAWPAQPSYEQGLTVVGVGGCDLHARGATVLAGVWPNKLSAFQAIPDIDCGLARHLGSLRVPGFPAASGLHLDAGVRIVPARAPCQNLIAVLCVVTALVVSLRGSTLRSTGLKGICVRCRLLMHWESSSPGARPLSCRKQAGASSRKVYHQDGVP